MMMLMLMVRTGGSMVEMNAAVTAMAIWTMLRQPRNRIFQCAKSSAPIFQSLPWISNPTTSSPQPPLLLPAATTTATIMPLPPFLPRFRRWTSLDSPPSLCPLPPRVLLPLRRKIRRIGPRTGILLPAMTRKSFNAPQDN